MSIYSESSFTATFDAMSKAKSFYIPLLPKDLILSDGSPLHQEPVLRRFFERILCLGEVSRIDYITKPTKVDATAISAFVHFKDWQHSNATDYIIRQFNSDGEVNIDCYYDETIGNMRPFTSTFNQRRRFFKLKVNRSPIPEVVDVPTNLSQIVHDNGAMRIILQEKDARIAELEEEVRRLTSMVHSPDYEPNMTVMTVEELV